MPTIESLKAKLEILEKEVFTSQKDIKSLKETNVDLIKRIKKLENGLQGANDRISNIILYSGDDNQ